MELARQAPGAHRLLSSLFFLEGKVKGKMCWARKEGVGLKAASSGSFKLIIKAELTFILPPSLGCM